MKVISLLTQFRWLIITAAFFKWMAFHVWLLNSKFGVEWNAAVWDGLVSNFLLLGIILGLINLLLNQIPESGKIWLALAFSFFLSWIWKWIVIQALVEVSPADIGYADFLVKSEPVRWCIGFLLIAGVTVSTVFYKLYDIQKSVIQRDADTKAFIKEAELQKLQLQLQPHFLFNSLNSINAMITIKPAEARKMVEQLSDFLRITTRRADESWVKFSDEWHYLQLYLGIEKVRFGHRLDIQSSISEPAQEYKLPTLLLQPLVENAIKFGLYGTTEHVAIKINAEILHGMLTVTIQNPFEPDMLPPQGSGFGLRGLKRRLYLLFAQNDLLTTTAIDHTFVVTLKIPSQHV
jgi:sensor histidine kinase YesM